MKMKPIDNNGLLLMVVLAVIVLAAGYVRMTLADEINHWPNRPDTNHWYEFIRLIALAVLITIAVAIAKLGTDSLLARLASS